MIILTKLRIVLLDHRIMYIIFHVYVSGNATIPVNMAHKEHNGNNFFGKKKLYNFAGTKHFQVTSNPGRDCDV